ncbi:MAG: dethiobiotin synthase [Gammaproteobacteria bacterium]|nr:dethiobiotin synthase [Gammaproteobacteria bacterium]
MIRPDEKGYFVTGSDTDVGKTYIACEIVRQLRQCGFEVATRKPVESGCREADSGELLTHDAAALQAANDNRESIERITAYRYRAALAPHRAARLENQRIQLETLVEACDRDHSAQRLVVEGAGGFYSPLAENGLNADLASALQLPVIVVVDDRVGAVNQALMTLQAVASRQLNVAALVLNQLRPTTEAAMDNAADLHPYSSLPVFRCSYQGTLAQMFENHHDPE